MSTSDWLTKRLWGVIALLAVLTCLIAGFAAFNSTFTQTASRMAGIVDFTKSQSMTYDSFNDASVTKSLLRSVESVGQLARDIEQDGGAIDEASLQRYCGELSMTGAFVLDPQGRVLGAYSSDEVGADDLASELFGDAVLNVVDHPNESYTSRVQLHDGSYVDVACVARRDAAGIVVSAYHTSIGFANRYSLTLQSMIEGYNAASNGSIVVEHDDDVVAANMLTADQLRNEGIGQRDLATISAIKDSCEPGKASLVKADGSWYIASFDKARDYFVYTYVPVSESLGGVALSVLLAAALYAVVVALFIIARRQAEHDHLRELIDQEHQYGQRLAESARAAQSANTAKTEFLQRMSHDIRTPINGIRGMVEMGNAFDDDIVKQRECRQKIWSASGILLDLVSEVLDMSKLESGEVELDERPCDLVALNAEVCEMLERQAAEAGISITCDNSGIEHPRVLASQLHLKRLIMNIASNAVKYNRPGGTVSLTYSELGCDKGVATYRIVVADTGIGMSDDFQQHLFEPFSREVQMTESQPSGTGLGTVIAKQLAELMGGSIEFQSELGHGTVCTITLPLAIDTSSPSTSAAPEETENVTLEGLSILLAEDNELNREIAEFVLDEAGARVTTAFDGREALTAFEQAEPGAFDLILMDIMMPNMDGYAATRAIRRLPRPDARTIPIVAMSANAFTDDVKRSREAGMDEHLAKPIDADKLVRAIARRVHR